MAQKIALIRATLHEPDWIFCDEPTAGLDPVAAADMRAYLGEQRARGAALIVTTHMLGEAELIADRIAIMRQGVVVKAGTLEELRRESGDGRRFMAHLAGAPADVSRLAAWLDAHALSHQLEGDTLAYSLRWGASTSERAEFAARLQQELVAGRALPRARGRAHAPRVRLPRRHVGAHVHAARRVPCRAFQLRHRSAPHVRLDRQAGRV